MFDRLRHLADVLGAALLAPACVLCRREAAGARLCEDCLALLVPNGNACARCAEPLPQPTALCGKCSRHPPAFDAAWAGFQYLAPLDQLVQRLKFGDALAVGRALLPHWLSALRTAREASGDPLPAALIPVPLHPSRLRQRGYNQALELARDLGRDLAIPVMPALTRARATAPMPGLDWDARRRNVRDAFAVTAAALPQHIALVDDVMTSGATVNEAARVLKRAGVQRVEVIVLARKP